MGIHIHRVGTRVMHIGAGGVQVIHPRSAGVSPLAADCLGFWKLEEAGGDRIDATGLGNTLTAYGAPGRVAGVVGFAAEFVKASDQWLERAHDGNLDPGLSDFALSIWIWPGAYTVYNGAFNRGGQSNTNAGLLLMRVAAGTIRAYFSNGTVRVDVSAAVTAGAWNHIIVSVDRSANMTIYVNNDGGASVDISALAGPVNNVEQFEIGTYRETTWEWNGHIDAVGWWHRLLTASERTALYNGGAGLEYPF